MVDGSAIVPKATTEVAGSSGVEARVTDTAPGGQSGENCSAQGADGSP